MKIRGLYAGMPGAASFNPLIPDTGDGTSGGTIGGAGAPPAAPPVTPPAPPTPPAAGASQAPANGEHGFPAGTPVAEMSDAQRANYYAHFNRRDRAELERVQAELAAAKPLAEQFAALEAASRTDQERAIEAARTEAAALARTEADAAARDRYAPVLVAARLESALAGRMTAAQVAALMPTLNVAALLDGAGLPDDAKIGAFAAAIPAAPVTPLPPVPSINLGAGRTAPVSTSGFDVGAERARSQKRPAT